ncbi:MAG: hypothetical protein V4507_05760, partial [Verrucomicrobiota bacterium]
MPKLKYPKKKKPLFGIDRRALFPSSSRAGQFKLEAIEPRCLLDANLYSGDTSATSALAANIQSTFTDMAKLGTALNQDSTLGTQVVPFLGKSVSDLFNQSLGQFLIGGTNNNKFTNLVSNYFATDVTPTTAELATNLNTAVKAVFGTNASVTDASTSSKLQLNFNVDLTKATSAFDLELGNEAQEFALTLADNAKINLGLGGTFKFSINADLSTFTSTALNNTEKYWVDFGSVRSGNTMEMTASARQSTSGTGVNAPLNDFGVGFGLIGARETLSGAGGYVTNGTFALDLNLKTNFNTGSDGFFTLTDLNSYQSDFSTAYSVSIPSGSTGGAQPMTQNSAQLVLPVNVANPTGNTFISGLNGLTGTFTLTADHFFNNRVPTVTASDQTLASLSRMSADDLLQYVRNISNLMSQTEQQQELQSLIPFLDISLGEAYNFQTATDQALVNPLTLLTNIVTAKNAPSTSSDPLNFTGSSSFKIYVYRNGTLLTPSTGTTVTLSTDSSRNTLTKLKDALQAALPTISGTKYVQARLTDTASPRLELYGDDQTTFYIENINPSGETLDLGINPYEIVFARNNGTITGTGDAKYQLSTVNAISSSAVNLTTFTTPLVFTVQIGSNATKTVTVPPENFFSMGSFASAIQKALNDQGLYNISTGEGIRVTENAAGSGFGLKFTYSGSTPQSFSIAGTNASFFNLGSLSGSSTNSYTVSSSTPIVVSNFSTPQSISFTIRQQNGGTTNSTTGTIQIPADYYTSLDQLKTAIQTALANQDLYDATTQTGVLVRVVSVTGGGMGLEFYGSADVFELGISGAGLAKLGMTATTSSASSINVSVKKDGSSSATTTTLYINGNTTRDYFGDAANSKVDDLVDDIHDALVRSGLLDATTGKGVDIRAIADSTNHLTDTIEFFASNPGQGTGY